MGEGREGDWECSGCRNRNYAFRSFCNRCKQPRLLVDPKTPADSKWLPRIGDWICTGCTNNNYASREKCKKCGQPKEVAAMPAIAMLGASLPTYANYFARAQGGPEQKMNLGLYGNGVLPNSLPMGSNWSMGGAANYGVQATSTWPLGSGLPYASPAAQIIPKGWRNGDWMCNCGFHNYSSRAQCKKCNACMPPALGTKRLATEELADSWDNKRLNAGQTNANQLSHVGFDQAASSLGDQTAGIYAPFPPATLEGTSNSQVNVPLPELATVPTHMGNGSRQWRDGDWMCSNCNNHNYASRSQCNKCKTQREGHAQPVGVA